MSRRAALPGADELFRVTSPARTSGERAEPPATGPAAAPGEPADAAPPRRDPADPGEPRQGGEGARAADPPRVPARPSPARRRVTVARRTAHQEAEDHRSSGRERHEEKITVYVSAEELFDLEHARLVLRGEHGIVADRGRIVREAVAVVIADLESKGPQSILVRRLAQG